MPNTYFDFKQFRINQDQTGMKVTTDSCLFGALIADLITQKEPKSILDIGTGTGLLSLMLAQATQRSSIMAVEIESGSFSQARLNFDRSPWSDRLEIRHTSIQDFGQYELLPPFDLMVCNPPFFQNNQLGQDDAKNQALHNSTLSFEELASSIQRLIALDGMAFVMYPPSEMAIFIEEMDKKRLLPQDEITIQDKGDTKVIRTITSFCFNPKESVTRSVVIKQENGEYTSEFQRLLKEFYLHL